MLRLMQVIQSSTSKQPDTSGWAPLALGFRPFFALSAVAAVVLIGIWTAVWHGQLGVPAYYDAVAWHAHEMLFGYVVAVVAGFLLTAVRNWTGQPTWTGRWLGVLVLLWLSGRVLPWLPGVPMAVATAVDVAFLPLLAAALIRPLWRGQNKVNRVFVLLLAGMALANVLSHLQLQGSAGHLGDARQLMLAMVLLLIVLVAGRVLPFFTQNVILGFAATRRASVEQASLAGIVLIAAAQLVGFVPKAVLAFLWLGFAVLQVVRLVGWFHRGIFAMPVLWVLHAGYAWLCVGALLQGLSLLGLFPASLALHALTVGAIGVFTLGMMARVSRGHTGRPIQVSGFMTIAFSVANLAAIVRVFGPALWSEHYALWLDLSGLMWMLVFTLFAVRYVPMLMRPRIDGNPG